MINTTGIIAGSLAFVSILGISYFIEEKKNRNKMSDLNKRLNREENEDFLEEFEKNKEYFSEESISYIETLKNEKNNNRLTELNHLILDFMKENKDKYDNSFSSKIIAEGLDTAAKKISGSIRKLVNLGLVEKTNENPVIYALRED